MSKWYRRGKQGTRVWPTRQRYGGPRYHKAWAVSFKRPRASWKRTRNTTTPREPYIVSNASLKSFGSQFAHNVIGNNARKYEKKMYTPNSEPSNQYYVSSKRSR